MNLISIRILIADGNEVFRAGIRSVLEENGWTIAAETGDAREAVQKAMTENPHIVTIDCSSLQINGIETIQQIVKYCPKTQILALANYEQDDLIRNVLQAGARGFVLKSDSKKTLTAAIEALSLNKPFFSNSLSEKLLDSFLSGGNKEGSQNLLTQHERVVVQLIAEGHSNKIISKILNRSPKTIESHRAAAMKKLKLNSTAALVRYAVRNKLIEP